MLNIYDILLNFQDSNRVYEFFEWTSKDDVEHIKKIPMIKISSSFFDKLLKYKVIIDTKFLDKIYKKTEVYNHNKVSVIDYSCLFTDGNKVMAIEFNNEGKSQFKSSLLLDEEDELLELSNDLKNMSISYRTINKKTKELFLTREEEFKKNYLLKELRNAKKNNKYEKINYLYEEVYPSDNKCIEDKYKILMTDISDNYRDCYNELFKILKLINSKKNTISN